MRKRTAKPGWRLNGKRVYKVKGKRKSTRKTYSSKTGALSALKRRGKR